MSSINNNSMSITDHLSVYDLEHVFSHVPLEELNRCASA